MEDNKNLVAEATENVEIPTEETQPIAKTYTQEEVDAIVGKVKARAITKIRKENERKYGNLENVLRAGTGKESVEEITDTFTKFYQSKGIKLPEKPNYSAKDIEILAKAEANDVINSGYEDVVEEVDRLAQIGFENMTPRDKVYFKALAEHRQGIERRNELSKIGVTEDVLNSKEFQDFARKFNPTTPIADVYSIYSKTLPKKEIKPMGSMKQTSVDEVKDYYTEADIEKLSPSDLKNPRVWDAVRRSMTGG